MTEACLSGNGKEIKLCHNERNLRACLVGSLLLLSYIFIEKTNAQFRFNLSAITGDKKLTDLSEAPISLGNLPHLFDGNSTVESIKKLPLEQDSTIKFCGRRKTLNLKDEYSRIIFGLYSTQ